MSPLPPARARLTAGSAPARSFTAQSSLPEPGAARAAQLAAVWVERRVRGVVRLDSEWTAYPIAGPASDLARAFEGSVVAETEARPGHDSASGPAVQCSGRRACLVDLAPEGDESLAGPPPPGKLCPMPGAGGQASPRATQGHHGNRHPDALDVTRSKDAIPTHTVLTHFLPPNRLPAFLRTLRGVDIVCGSRRPWTRAGGGAAGRLGLHALVAGHLHIRSMARRPRRQTAFASWQRS